MITTVKLINISVTSHSFFASVCVCVCVTGKPTSLSKSQQHSAELLAISLIIANNSALCTLYPQNLLIL